MTVAAASPRIIGAVCALALTAGALAACTPTPEPSPTPTALFSSDEEAFAAAEETYRAYTEALNDVDTSDPATFEPIYAFETGDFAERDKKNLSTMHAEGYSMKGDTIVLSFDGTEANAARDEVVGIVCVDVSATDIVDRSGQSIVPKDRAEVFAATVKFVAEGDELRIARADAAEDTPCDG